MQSDVIDHDVADDEPSMAEDASTVAPQRVAPTESAPPPVSRRAPRVTVVARDEASTLATVVAWDAGRWRALAVVEAPNGPTLGEDLLALHGALTRALRDGSRPPREVAFLWSAVTAAVVDVPAAGLPADRMEALLGWELEPFLPGEEGHGAPSTAPGESGTASVACGWARPEGPGPLLACGVRPAVRDELREALARAGLRLRGLYPLLGCAAAELERGSAGARVVIETGSGAVAATRVEGERVTRTRIARCPAGAEAATAMGLVPDDAGLVLGAPLPTGLPDLIGDDARVLPGAVEAPLLPSGLLGAARHALSLPGGERLACVPPQARRRPIRLGRAQLLALGAAALLVLGIVGAELGLTRALAERQERLQALGPLGAGENKKALETRLAQARAQVALRGELEARRRLPELLRAVAGAAPEELMIERLAEEGDGSLRLEGAALSELSVRRFARDLELLLQPLGLTASSPELRRRDDPAAAVVSYAFTLRCRRVEGNAR